MKKIIITGICLLILISTLLFLNLGLIIKTAVNAYGPDVTKTVMHVDDATVSLLAGEARFTDFMIGNPKGFTSPHAILVGSVFVDVDETSLTKDVIIIDRIAVNEPEIIYEINGNTDNIHTIINNMKKPQKAVKPNEKKETGKKAGKKVVIRDLILRDVNVIMAVPGLKGQTISTAISEIHFKNIGQNEKGVLLPEVLLRVLIELYGQIISPDAISKLTKEMKIFGVEIEDLGRQTRRHLESMADDLYEMKDDVEAIRDQLGELFGK
jgi:hypothetical protein